MERPNPDGHPGQPSGQMFQPPEYAAPAYADQEPKIYTRTAGPQIAIISSQPGVSQVEVGHESGGIKPHPFITIGLFFD